MAAWETPRIRSAELLRMKSRRRSEYMRILTTSRFVLEVLCGHFCVAAIHSAKEHRQTRQDDVSRCTILRGHDQKEGDRKTGSFACNPRVRVRSPTLLRSPRFLTRPSGANCCARSLCVPKASVRCG